MGRSEKKTKKKSSNDRQLLLTVAYLVGNQGFSQKAIADQLNLSESVVSRRVKDALDLGLLERSVVCKLTPDEEKLVRDELSISALQHDLEDYCSSIKPHNEGDKNRDATVKLVSVTWLPNELGGSEETFENAVVHFGELVAEEFFSELKSSRICGVGWGRTLLSVCRGLEIHQLKRRPDFDTDGWSNPPDFYPQYCDMIAPKIDRPRGVAFFDPDEYSATSIARRLHLMTRKRGQEWATDGLPLSLRGVHSFIPASCVNSSGETHEFDDEELSAIINLFKSSSAFRQIFPRKNGKTSNSLVENADAMLVSAGGNNPENCFYAERIKASAGKRFGRKLNLSKVVGDLGGAFLAPRGETLPEFWQSHFLGPEESHFRQCALRANDNESSLGVVLFAVGKSRGEICLEAINRGLVNRLYVDSHCAQSILDTIEKRQHGL